jgi:cell wall-associated NlpC family hydrolase
MARAAVIREAAGWIGTPYRHMGRIKGPKGGCDCLTLLAEVYERAGIVAHLEIPFYPMDWHLHRGAERYLDGLMQFAREVAAPEPGDAVLFRFGRCFAHGGIVTQWPMLIHSWNGMGVVPVDSGQPLLGGRPTRFFDPFAIASPPPAPRNEASPR